MVHTRLNKSEPNPNPHINFITALSASEPQDQENARQFLRALAAQVRPVMKAHGFVVNSLEEYEHNSVFAGRNWNHGETVELVLRRPGGMFLPTSWLMSTLCHELAHIKHMNHGPAFQALWRDLRNEVRQLQNKGYYGDGYWSSGKHLADSATMTGEGIDHGELPEYMCGGAHSRSRPSFKRRKRRLSHEGVLSNHTGRQTAKKRKPGSRITSKYAFVGEGLSLSEDLGKGTGKGKRASSYRAREERALAAERRLNVSALKNEQASTSKTALSPETDNETGSDVEFVETDAERRENLFVTAESGQGLSPSVISWSDYDSDFIFTENGQTGVLPASKPSYAFGDSGPPCFDAKGKQKAVDRRHSLSRGPWLCSIVVRYS
ncbi:WLM-domain-containing protein [Marasmius fiardii PR-910]|nr:WLM-domain-containing protein [Marasmius fiardii PR-910]